MLQGLLQNAAKQTSGEVDLLASVTSPSRLLRHDKANKPELNI